MVIACSVGFPTSDDSLPGKMPFVFFGTAVWRISIMGNYGSWKGELESRKATHRFVFFNGGHEWASVGLPTDAFE